MRKRKRKGTYKSDYPTSINSAESLNNARGIFFARTLKFTETVVVWVTILYVLNWLVSVSLIVMAIKETANFAYLDTLITETSNTFRDIVGIAVIKFGVENIFKYNEFGGKIASKPEENVVENQTEGGIQG